VILALVVTVGTSTHYRSAPHEKRERRLRGTKEFYRFHDPIEVELSPDQEVDVFPDCYSAHVPVVARQCQKETTE
jgi:hypothetical protein